MWIRAGTAEHFGGGAGGPKLIIQEVAECADARTALGEAKGSLGIKGDEVLLDGAADVEADTQRLHTTGDGDGVLELVEIFAAALGEVLVGADGAGGDVGDAKSWQRIEWVSEGRGCGGEGEADAGFRRTEFVDDSGSEDMRPGSGSELAWTALQGVKTGLFE